MYVYVGPYKCPGPFLTWSRLGEGQANFWNRDEMKTSPGQVLDAMVWWRSADNEGPRFPPSSQADDDDG